MTATAARRGIAGWPAVALIALAFVVTMLGTTLPTPLYPAYAREFGFGGFVTTLVFSAYAAGVVVSLLLFGHWSDQLGRRPMLLAALGFSAMSAVAFLLPGALGWLFVGRVLSGLSAGIATGTATATVVDLAPPNGRARAGLIAAAVNMAGLGTGPVLAGVLTQYAPLPLRLCFVVDLVLIAVAGLAVFLVREPVSPATERQLKPRRLHVPDEVRGVFTRAAIAGFAGFAVLGLFTAVSPSFVGMVLGRHNAALVGLVVFVLFLASVVGQTLSERLGLDRALPVGCGGLILGMVIIAISLEVPSLALLVIGAVVAGVGQGLSFRAGLGSVASAAPDDLRAEVTSTFFVVLYVGISLPVIGEGALATSTSLVTAGVVFAVVVTVLAAVALVLLLRGRAHEAARG